METKTCKQCGELKPITQFRKYYGGRKGTYKTCKVCERINSRVKYLNTKGDKRSDAENAELDKIHALWAAQRAIGLNPPKSRAERTASVTEDLDSMLNKYQAMASSVDTTEAEAPAELLKWLHEPLTETPEYYQENVYEQLKDKYRPQVRIDTATMLPVYDDTYKTVLDKIAARFDEYEDNYYSEG